MNTNKHTINSVISIEIPNPPTFPIWRHARTRFLVIGICLLLIQAVLLHEFLLANNADYQNLNVFFAPITLLHELPFGGFAVRSSEASVYSLVSRQPTSINICHAEWLGIREATYGQGLPVLEIPGIISPEHANNLIKFFKLIPLQQVIINGIPPNIVDFIYKLNNELPHVEILFIYHSSPASPFHMEEAGLVNDMIVATKQGIISRIGLVKNAMMRSLSEGLGVRAFEIWNFPKVPFSLRSTRLASQLTKWHVGVLGTAMIHKNIFTQVLGLCSLSNVVIHVLKKPKAPYFEHCKASIVEHGEFLEHDQFVKVVLSMDIILYVSLTECFPMTIVESISVGIPAITSATSAIYSLDPVLQEYLVVNELDSPDHITSKVEKLIENYDYVSLRLWELIPPLLLKVRRQWRLFIENLQESDIPDVPEVTYRVPRSLKALMSSRLPTVAFVTYELYPVSTHGGGAGVVINGLVVELLKAGHDVIVLCDFAPELVQAYRDHHTFAARENRYRGSLEIYLVNQLIQGLQVKQSKSIFITKSRSFALALKLIYSKTPFDMVECFDYAGVAYELLRSQRSAKDSYFPLDVNVAVRVHGTLQLIDQAEQVTKADDERQLMYLMEQYSLLAADLVLCQTQFIRRYISMAYGIHPNLLSLAPPPMSALLSYLDQSVANVTVTPSWQDSRTFLIYGRLQLVKGLETIVRAGISFLEKYKRIWPDVRFVFLGWDIKSQEHGIMTSVYLKSLIPPYLSSHFQFVIDKPVDRPTLIKWAATARAAIFASSFDTFNLALHEVAHLHVPIILSRIPAFMEYFNSYNSFSFDVNDSKSLELAISASLLNDTFAENIRRNGPTLSYAESVTPYRFYDYGGESGVLAHRRDITERVLVLENLILSAERKMDIV